MINASKALQRGHALRERCQRLAWAVVLAWALVATASAAPPNESIPAARADLGTEMPALALTYKNATIARYNPDGLQNRFQLGLRKRLSDSPHILLKNTYVFTALHAMLTPSLQRVGGHVEVQPLAVLNLYATAEYVWFMGNFDFVTSYQDASEDFSDTALAQAGDQGSNYETTGSIVSVGARLQAKVGVVAVRSNNMFQRWKLATQGGDPLFYDPTLDLLLPANGWAFIQNNDLIYVKGRLVAGLRHTMSRSYIPASLLPQRRGSRSPRGVTHRMGPFVAWRLTREARYAASIFRRPTLVVLSQWFLQHPYRTGQDVPQGVPWIAVVLAFDGQLARY